MKKKLSFLLFIILLINFSLISSLQIETEENFSLGENFIAKVSGSFYTPLTKSNIYFYRGQSETSFGVYSLQNIEGIYYVSFGIPLEKISGNYSIQIKNAKYFIGGQLSEENVTKYFTIEDKKAFASISPALSIPENYYYDLSVTNLNLGGIDILYGLEGTIMNETSLISGETKILTLKTFGGNKFEKILFSFDNETYSAFVYSQLEEIPVENQVIEEENQNEENPEEEETPGFWDLIFGEEEEENETNGESNESNTQTDPPIEICEEFSFPFCSDDQRCEGKLVDGVEGQCCDGACIDKEEPSSSWKTIGWIAIGATAILLAWFCRTTYSKIHERD